MDELILLSQLNDFIFCPVSIYFHNLYGNMDKTLYQGKVMILISYDISNDKLRTKFSKFLEKYGHRIQYSVFEIDNSSRILNNISSEINNNFGKKFSQADSVYIFEMSASCKIKRYGYAKNEEKSVIVI